MRLISPLLFIFFFWVSSRHFVNIPNADDFDVYLVFLHKIRKHYVLGDFFQPHNEHLLAFNRFVAFLLVLLFGKLNIIHLLLLGQIALFTTGMLLPRLTTRARPQALLFISLILYHPMYAEATQWATASLQLFGSTLFALGACLLLEKQKPWPEFFASILALSAMLTQANGLLLPLIFAFIFLIRKDIVRSAYWSACGVLSILLIGPKSTLPQTLNNPQLILDYAVSFLGSAVGFQHHIFALLGGISILVIWLITASKLNFSLLAFFTFIVLTAVSNAISRGHLGVEFSFSQSRYTFVSLLAISCAYLALGHLVIIKRPITQILFTVATIFSVTSYVVYSDELLTRKQVLEDSILRWQVTKNGLAHPNPSHATKIMNSATSMNLYEPPTINLSSFIAPQITEQLSLGRDSLVFQVEFLETSLDFVIVSGWGFSQKQDILTKHAICLHDGRYIASFQAISRTRTDVSRHFHNRSIVKSGFIALIPLRELRSGTYTVGIAVNHQCALTRRTIDIS